MKDERRCRNCLFYIELEGTGTGYCFNAPPTQPPNRHGLAGFPKVSETMMCGQHTTQDGYRYEKYLDDTYECMVQYDLLERASDPKAWEQAKGK